METSVMRGEAATGPRVGSTFGERIGGIPRLFVGGVGRRAEGIARGTGEMAGIFWGTFSALVRGQLSFREIAREAYAMGVQSLPIVMIAGVLSGVVTSQQGGYQFTGSVPLYVVGSVVTSSVVMELGPVLTAIVFIGRVGARITAELGTMKVSEQIDALHSLGRDPIRTLAAPRIIAGVITLPLLVAIANVIGVTGGMLTAGATLGLGRESFMYGARLFFHTFDLFYSIGKAVVFGLIVPLIATHMGFRTYGGAEGVGRATTTAVVYMIMAVLVLDATFPMIFLR
ncbi:MAG: ABC transporter permease [Gemmatimonadota bacterium]|nr:ABC transporter permease [Gemmatimonadota bacterium]